MTPDRTIAALLYAVALLSLPGCAKRDERRPNVILISIDSLRRDRLGCYGYSRPVSPTLDRLAHEGVLFEDVLSQSSWTLPAHASLMTSLYVHKHGFGAVIGHAHEDHAMLAEAFHESGYTTAAVVSGSFVRREFGFAEGFDRFDESPATNGDVDRATGVGTKTNEAVLAFLDSKPSAPFFLFIHYWDVHFDYSPPRPYSAAFGHDSATARSFANFARDKTINASLDAHDRAQLAALYDGEIRFTDHLIAEVLAALRERGDLERSIVVVTSDHGEEFFEHGGKGHQRTLYEEVVRIPLIFWFGGEGVGGRIVSEKVELIDVFPTLLEAAGIEHDKSAIDGRSLLSAIRGAPAGSGARARNSRPRMTETQTRSFVAKRTPRFALEAIELDGKKLHVWRTAEPRRELYDLRSDPGEAHDLSSTDEPSVAALDALLTERLAHRSPASDAEAESLDPSTEEQLRALGYID